MRHILDTDPSLLTDERRVAIQQYMVDWGDRRVFAGVHYMTDNIASWWLAMTFVPFLFHDRPEIADLARQAIITRSRVYRDIQQHFDTGELVRVRDFLNSFLPEDGSVPAAGT